MSSTPLQVPFSARAPFLRRAALASLIALAAALASCRTTEGFGNDVKHLGGNIEDSAAKNK